MPEEAKAIPEEYTSQLLLLCCRCKDIFLAEPMLLELEPPGLLEHVENFADPQLHLRTHSHLGSMLVLNHSTSSRLLWAICMATMISS